MPLSSASAWKWPVWLPLALPVTATVESPAAPGPRKVIPVFGETSGTPGLGNTLTVPLASTVAGLGVGSGAGVAGAPELVLVVCAWAGDDVTTAATGASRTITMPAPRGVVRASRRRERIADPP